jgi:Flp pilus assembly protein TadD
MKTRFTLGLLAAGWLFAVGCKPKPKEPSSLQRKEAATLVSEAQFALQLKDLTRAEGLLAKAVELSWDAGKVWVDLGSVRVRRGKKDAARTAYQAALKAYEDEAAKPADAKDGAGASAGPDVGPWMQQVYVLALLGRVDDARAVLAKAQKKFPESRAVRAFAEQKQIDKMIADPAFKLIAL